MPRPRKKRADRPDPIMEESYRVNMGTDCGCYCHKTNTVHYCPYNIDQLCKLILNNNNFHHNVDLCEMPTTTAELKLLLVNKNIYIECKHLSGIIDCNCLISMRYVFSQFLTRKLGPDDSTQLKPWLIDRRIIYSDQIDAELAFNEYKKKYRENLENLKKTIETKFWNILHRDLSQLWGMRFCICCPNSSGLFGLSFPCGQDRMKCYSCQRTWCSRCDVPFGKVVDGISHDNKSCENVVALKGQDPLKGLCVRCGRCGSAIEKIEDTDVPTCNWLRCMICYPTCHDTEALGTCAVCGKINIKHFDDHFIEIDKNGTCPLWPQN